MDCGPTDCVHHIPAGERQHCVSYHEHVTKLMLAGMTSCLECACALSMCSKNASDMVPEHPSVDA